MALLPPLDCNIFPSYSKYVPIRKTYLWDYVDFPEDAIAKVNAHGAVVEVLIPNFADIEVVFDTPSFTYTLVAESSEPSETTDNSKQPNKT